MGILISTPESVESLFKTGLKKCREEKAMNQQDFANHANISLESLRNYEQNKNHAAAGVKLETLAKLCVALECTPDYLLGIREYPTPKVSAIAKETGLTKEAIAELGESGSYKLYGPDIQKLLSLLIADSDFFYALMSVLSACEWAHKPQAEPFLVSDLEKYVYGIKNYSNQNAFSFYMQEAQARFRKAAEKAVETVWEEYHNE